MQELDFSVFPKLETERLDLRELVMADANAVHRIRSNEKAMRYIGRPLSRSVNDAAALLLKLEEDRKAVNGITWGVCLKDEKSLIGSIGLYRLKKEHFRGELGYVLHPDYWGKGLMSEAIQAVLETAFNVMGFHSLEACVNPGNSSSIKILQRNGFQQEGAFRECFYFEGKFYDSVVFSLLASDFSSFH